MIDQAGQTRKKSELDTIDQATLTPLVRRARSSATIEIIDWRYSQVHGGAGDVGGGLSGIYRFVGRGFDQGEIISWSLILKITGASTANDDPSDPRYWKREMLAYQSGRLDDLPGGLAAPRCFDIVERSDREAWLWLEDISDEIGARWPLEHYGLVARHLGQFNGAYLHSYPLPSDPWLSRGWLRALVYRAEPGIVQLRNSLDHPLLRRLYPDKQADRTFALWAERETFLDALDRLPQTFCHRDAFRRNLFARRRADGREQTVAVDWTYAGIGAIGEDINPLVNASLYFSEVEPAEAKALDDIVFNGYLTGLEDAGWQGDPRLVRFGFTAASALCFDIGYQLGDGLPMILDENAHPWMEHAFGQPIEQLMDLLAGHGRFSLDLADEAKVLLGSLRALLHKSTF
jgi:Phosphotransferase enzyme family